MKYLTRCILCPEDRGLQLSADPFDDIPLIGEAPPERLLRFMMKLEEHIQKEGQREGKTFEKQQKSNGHSLNLTDTAKLMMEQARHMGVLASIAPLMNTARMHVVASAFQTQDPVLLGLKERARYQLHAVSRHPERQIPDNLIQHKVSLLGLNPEQERAVFDLLQDMRDLLTDQGRYAPQSGMVPQVTA